MKKDFKNPQLEEDLKKFMSHWETQKDPKLQSDSLDIEVSEYVDEETLIVIFRREIITKEEGLCLYSVICIFRPKDVEVLSNKKYYQKAPVYYNAGDKIFDLFHVEKTGTKILITAISFDGRDKVFSYQF